MLLNGLQHMKLAKHLLRKASGLPRAQRSRMVKRANLHAALARAQADDPSLSPQEKPDLPRSQPRR